MGKYQSDVDWDIDRGQVGFDFSALLQKVKSLWAWMLMSVSAFLSIAVLYLYCTPKVYKSSAQLLIKNNDNKMSGGGSGTFSTLQDLGIIRGSYNVNNEEGVLQSFILMSRVVRDLDLNAALSAKSGLKTLSLYGSNSPYNIRLLDDRSDSTAILPVYRIIDKGTSFLLRSEGSKDIVGSWERPLNLPEADIVVSRNTVAKFDGDKTKIFFSVQPFKATTNALRKQLSVSLPDKNADLINLSISNSVQERGDAILNTLIKEYLQSNIEDNRLIADSTISFVNQRIDSVGRELGIVEHTISQFKEQNKITDLSEQGKMLVSVAADANQKLGEQSTLLNVVTALESYMQKNIGVTSIIPASLMVEDGTLTGYLQNYNQLVIHRQQLILNYNPGSDIVKNVDQQIINLRQDILNSLRSIKNSATIVVSDLTRRNRLFEQQMETVPNKEKTLIGIMRQQSLKQDLYLFLLQKKEEAEITKNSTIANAKVVDYAQTDDRPVAPRKPQILAIALLAGIVMPFAVSYLFQLLNTNVINAADLRKHTSIPLLAELGKYDGEGEVIDGGRLHNNLISEQFRILRTNLSFLAADCPHKIVAITSSMSGEGKSFIAIHLAQFLSLAGKRVLLMEMDLRHPKVLQYMGLTPGVGFTNYIIDHTVSAEAIIRNYAKDACSFDIIGSGPIPPNAAELIGNQRTEMLLERLRGQYDYIIIDTAPCIVTDAVLLSQKSDITLFVVRSKVTPVKQLQNVRELQLNGRLKNTQIVLNGIDYKRLGYYGYYNYTHSYTS
ncbi:MAG: polysaccharide biosynthesis tyrosine autokinase [Chitinophagaceae bacterium]